MQAAKVLARGHAAHASVQLRYPDLDGIAASKVQQWIAAALSRADWDAFAMPSLPAGLSRFGFDAKSLFFAMHRPSDVAEHERARAHFAVREAVALFEKVAAARARRCGRMAETFAVDEAVEQRIRARLPFALTGEQDHAVRAIWSKLKGPSPMGVLLQGDVGTGKTAVAVAAALAVVAAGIAFGGREAIKGARSHIARIEISGTITGDKKTLDLIKRGGPFPYRRDGTVFQNREGLLPAKQRGYYREYTVPTPGSKDRGARRIVAGAQAEYYYTFDHYRTFRRIRE
jgi:ribonuclease T1